VAAWAIFWVALLALAVFDFRCLAPQRGLDGRVPPTTKAHLHCIFWFCVGLAFNAGVWAALGAETAMAWLDGYILEYLLSMDNVFFFHVVFKSYATPDDQIYQGLFLGILGAVLLRLAFYWVGAEFFRLAYIVQLSFGIVLIWSGYKTATSDEEEDDPRENRCVRVITRCLPLAETYDPHGALFVRRGACCEESGGVQLPEVIGHADPSEGASYSTKGGGRAAEWAICRVQGTMLLLVVVVLQVIDVIFAVDSVTAKLASHPGVFVNFSSSAFAMLCLRSLYFVLVRLLKFFRFLKYGVACILVLIGVKLIVSRWVSLPEALSLAVISGVFLLSIALSALPETGGEPAAAAPGGCVEAPAPGPELDDGLEDPGGSFEIGNEDLDDDWREQRAS